MEKEFRLFVKNLPADTSESDIRNLISKQINVKSIDLKEKKNFKEETNKFAFIQVTSTDKELQECFRHLQNEQIHGSPVNIELAKESFLDRLKREREENQLKKDKPSVPYNTHSNPDVINNSAWNKRKTFSDSDLIVADSDISKVSCSNNSHGEILDGLGDKPHLLEESQSKIHSGNLDKKSDVKRKRFSQKIVIESPVELAKVKKRESHTSVSCHNSVIGESEKKRIDSLRQKKQSYKMQGRIIRNALMDNSKMNKKIVFDDEIDQQDAAMKYQDNTIQKNLLFDSDNEDHETFYWDEDKLEEKANIREKLSKLQSKAGNDDRFKMDHRFIDDDRESSSEQVKESTLDGERDTDEKQWQLDILGNVLGKPVTTQHSRNESQGLKGSKKVMIRYDPTAIDHQNYEVKSEENGKKEDGKKKKKKQSLPETTEDVPIPISNELFYDVSDKLVESLQQSEGFSLLEAFGQKNQGPENERDAYDEASSHKKGFQFNFSKNPFRYDSSNDESDDDEKKLTPDLGTIANDVIMVKEDRFFFEVDDKRFREAETFFKNQSTYAEEDFKSRRRELKQIVRSKIRNNLRKKAPWTKKKIRKVKKS